MTLVYKFVMVLALYVGVLCVGFLLVHFMDNRKKRRH